MSSKELAKEIIVALIQADHILDPEKSGEAYETILKTICDAQSSMRMWLSSARQKHPL